MLSNQQFSGLFRQQIPFSLTPTQEQALTALSDFICYPSQNQLFILNGYAGTGKTTLVSALVRTLKVIRKNCILLAPTGRSAKVFSAYSGQKAYTIHKCLYYTKMQDGMREFSRRPNRLCNTVFIVDVVVLLTCIGDINPTLISGLSLVVGCFHFAIGEVERHST